MRHHGLVSAHVATVRLNLAQSHVVSDNFVELPALSANLRTHEVVGMSSGVMYHIAEFLDEGSF